jgi:acetyltransferase-like isoleucine patch superfamily enzyme
LLQSLIKIIILKIKYGGDIKVSISKRISWLSTFQINKGKISFERGIDVKRGVKISTKGGNITIGQRTSLNHNCMCVSYKSITIGEDCSIGPNVCIYDHDHAFNSNGKIKGKFKSSDITIENNVWIGANSVILRGSYIGANSVVGAGSVIKGIIPANSLVIQKREINIGKLR